MASVSAAVIGAQEVHRRAARVSPIATMIPLAMLAACNVLDVATTHRLLDMGAREMNPVAGWLIANNGLLMAKMMIVAIIGIAAVKAPPRRWIVPAMWAVALLYSSIITFHLVELAFA